MSLKRMNKIVLGCYALVSLIISFETYASSRSLPPNESIVITGETSLVCKYKCRLESSEVLKDKEDRQDKIVTFFSIKNRTIINELAMPEGTLLNLITTHSDISDDDFIFELEPNAKLKISNDSDSFLTLNCNKL